MLFQVVAEGLALCMQASLMRRHSDAASADAFCASRLGSAGGHAFGTLQDGEAVLRAIVDRAALVHG